MSVLAPEFHSTCSNTHSACFWSAEHPQDSRVVMGQKVLQPIVCVQHKRQCNQVSPAIRPWGDAGVFWRQRAGMGGSASLIRRVQKAFASRCCPAPGHASSVCVLVCVLKCADFSFPTQKQLISLKRLRQWEERGAVWKLDFGSVCESYIIRSVCGVMGWL